MTQRMHVHLTVTDLAASTAFYSKLFAQAPILEREDMVKWLLDAPALNFAISVGETAGVSHLGLESATAEAHSALVTSVDSDAGIVENEAECCYAVSDKLWLEDPDALSWELFHTHSRESDPEPAAPRQMPAFEGNGSGGCC